MTLTVGSLFSGIGGLDLGLERAGFKVIWQSEIDPFASKVLKKHWPEVTNYGDIKQIDWGTVERPDVICGGYPCQPFSLAGERKGTDDPRHLWPWVLEAISRLRPKYAILENVRGHLSMGGTTVIANLASIGYDAEWSIVRASDFGAPHRRERIFIIAYPNVQPDLPPKFTMGRKEPSVNTAGRLGVWDIHSRRGRWAAEPAIPRVDDGLPNRVDRVKGLGNAVVPQVAEYIGHLVMAAHNNA
jgi:DNA (cytosine-5)-methyltransferase 1